MDSALQLVIEMSEWSWNRFKADLEDLTPEEIHWRPLPQANTIHDILRHLHVEARLHLMSLESGEAMPVQVTVDSRQAMDAVPLDFAQNVKALEESYGRFCALLGETAMPALLRQTLLAYRNFPGETSRPLHLLAFHQAVHLAAHWGQIRTIRNLYRRTRGEPARFFPENPTFPYVDRG